MKSYRLLGKRECGFALIEIVVTIGVIAVLAATAVSCVIAWAPDYRLKRAARNLYSNMQSAKLEAVRIDRACRLVFDTGADTYQLQRIGPDGVWGTADDTMRMPVRLFEYGSGIGFGHGNSNTNATQSGGAFPGDKVSFTNNAVTFNSRGMCNAGYVYLENSDNSAYAVGALSTGVTLLRKWYPASSNWE